MSVAGTYECVTKTPMGDQKSTVTIVDNGDGTFSGTAAGAMGSMNLEDGKVDGNNITWVMNMTVPMPMKLEGSATIDGDTFTGSVNAGAFGNMAMSGTRA
ncbi:MAG: hypothetical protein EP350_01315 [Alphaproteobacteria bacterium]|jgi:hypothetical protein|nr:MAG: hypothetical protein EP350_01315 [Alphaproteobacteria bacterium]